MESAKLWYVVGLAGSAAVVIGCREVGDKETRDGGSFEGFCRIATAVMGFSLLWDGVLCGHRNLGGCVLEQRTPYVGNLVRTRRFKHYRFPMQLSS